MKSKLFHILMMICCVVPIIAILFFLPQLKSNANGSNLYWLILLLCPVMHIAMMKYMHKKD
ncbi:MAG: hypothetical protein APF84_01060 [Gracilibacter sp. BRH_c7a]|nr:MAG: hypothetical protein APF84_01060 [Gracilibacter sp. BRH_c7a]